MILDSGGFLKNTWLLLKMVAQVNAVLASSHNHIKIQLSYKTTIIQNYLKPS